MAKFAHHDHIYAALNTFNAQMLDQARVAFGGGTAITLLLGEFRLSNDIDLICAGRDSYRQMREWFFDADTRKALLRGLGRPREFEANRYSIKGYVQVPGFLDASPIKVEIFEEARISLDPFQRPLQHAPNIATLSQADFYAEKLLANEDRGRDPNVDSRDLIDLAMMVSQWGPIPDEAWAKVDAAYTINAPFLQRLRSAKDMLLKDPAYFERCLNNLTITEFDSEYIGKWLRQIIAPQESPPDPDRMPTPPAPPEGSAHAFRTNK